MTPRFPVCICDLQQEMLHSAPLRTDDNLEWHIDVAFRRQNMT